MLIINLYKKYILLRKKFKQMKIAVTGTGKGIENFVEWYKINGGI